MGEEEAPSNSPAERAPPRRTRHDGHPWKTGRAVEAVRRKNREMGRDKTESRSVRGQSEARQSENTKVGQSETREGEAVEKSW